MSSVLALVHRASRSSSSSGASGWLISWSAKQGPQNVEDEDHVGHVWDGDLEEWNNPAAALVAVPVLHHDHLRRRLPDRCTRASATRGHDLGWTQEASTKPRWRRPREVRFDLRAFRGDGFRGTGDERMPLQIGEALYASNCTTCHGSDARGARGYPNLTDDDWLWGGEPEQIVARHRSPRPQRGVMPPLGAALGGDEGVDNMVAVRTCALAWRCATKTPAAAQARSQCSTLCGACHGMTARATRRSARPNLTDDVWLYGGRSTSIRETIVERPQRRDAGARRPARRRQGPPPGGLRLQPVASAECRQ